jgi:tetratricopeptide (TPR) repeat protein
LNNEERIVLYILSLSESEDLLSADDISYISSLNIDEIGFNILPKLSSISLALSYKNGEQTIGYSLPHLAKIYIKKFLNLDNEKEVLEKFETFIQERKAFSNGDLSNIQLLSRSNASNHKEKVASNQALRALSISNFDYDVAIGHINELIKRINKFPFLYLIKGKIQDNSFLPDAYTLAKQEFLIAIDLDNHFTEALVELGYLELKNRVGKNKTSKEMIFEAIKYFTKVLDNEPKNHRAHLGLGQAFAAQSKDINYHYHREEKYSKAKLANDHFEKSYYTDDKITPTQVHSNAITAFNQALNLMKNLRDFQKAFEIASKGLTFEPKNSKLLNLQQDLSYKLNPEEYSKKLFTEKGWLKK